MSDIGTLKQSDISFLVAATLNAMSPLAGRTGQVQSNRAGGDIRAGSLTFTGSRDAKRPARIAGSLYQAAFLCKLHDDRTILKKKKTNSKLIFIFPFKLCVLSASVSSNGLARNGHG